MYFDSRTRVRCDIWIAKIIAFAKFRFTHPRRVRPFFSRRPNSACFDSRTRVGGDSQGEGRRAIVLLFRFTHPRRVRLHHRIGLDGHPHISIRAPVQGATHRTQSERKPRGVSIRAPAQGATAAAHQRKSHLPPDFDSRTRVRCDLSCNAHDNVSACFDSRTRMGATYSSSSQKEESIVLIRVPAQSATRGIFTRVKVCAF